MYSKLPSIAVLVSLVLGFLGIQPEVSPLTSQTGTTGAGSSSGSSPFAPLSGYGSPSAKEYKAHNSYVSNGGSTATSSSHHVCRFNMTLPSVNGSASISYGGTNYTGTLNSSSSGFVVAIQDPNGIGEITGLSSGAYIAGNVVVTGPTTTVHGVSAGVAPGTTVPLDLCATGSLSGSSPDASIVLTLVYDFTDSMGTHHTLTSKTYWTFPLNYVKNLCDDASIDTRKQYGDPGADGHVLSDPNRKLRPVNFGSWTYRGGLFIGNAAWSKGDQSGIARIQLWVNSGGTTGTYKAGCISLFDRGPSASRSDLYGNFDVGYYVPTSSSSATESTATWATRFPLNTDATSGGAAISTVSLPSTNSDDYTCWALGTGGVGSQIALALPSDETTSVAGPVWRYFASKEFQVDHSGSAFPLNDSAPRVWTIGEGTGSSWYVDTIP